MPAYPSFVRASVIGVALTFGYDALQVFVFDGMRRLADAAADQWIPIMLSVPNHLAWSSPAAVGLGAGDIAIPAVLVVIAGSAGQRAGTPALFWAAVSGYAVGLAAAGVVLTATGAMLPALIFLVPATIASVVLVAWRRCLLQELRGHTHAVQPAAGADAGTPAGQAESPVASIGS